MTDEAISPLRRRMIEDMTMRKLAPKTQRGYIRTIKNLAVFLGRSPDTASFEDVRRFQLHVAASGVGAGAVNATVAALRFFFRITLGRRDIIEHTTFIHEPRKLRSLSFSRRKHGSNDMPCIDAHTDPPRSRSVPAGSHTARTGPEPRNWIVPMTDPSP